MVTGLVSGTPDRCSVPSSRSNDTAKTEAPFFNVMFHNHGVSNFVSANKVSSVITINVEVVCYTDTVCTCSVHLNNNVVEYLDFSMPCSMTAYLAREQLPLCSNYTSAVILLFGVCAYPDLQHSHLLSCLPNGLDVVIQHPHLVKSLLEVA